MLRDDILLRIAADLDFGFFDPSQLNIGTYDPGDKSRLGRADLRGYQNRFVGKIKSCFEGDNPLPGLILALEPGAGKTGLTLTALRDLFDEGIITRALIVAPLLVAKTVWPLELDEWEHLTHTTYTLLRVEDDDPELVAYSDAVYAEALARIQAEFDAEVEAEPVLKKTQARAAVRYRWLQAAIARQTVEEREQKAKPKSAPSDLADEERNELVLTFKYAKLAELAREPTEIHIINKEALPWLWDHAKAQRKWQYEAIICDDLREGRGGKARTKRGKSAGNQAAPLSRFGVLASARKKTTAIIQLTGTPTPKGLPNLWGLAYLADGGERLGTAKEAYNDLWFSYNQYSRALTPHDHSFDAIMGKLKDIMFSIDPKDVGELPPYIIDPIYVRMPRKVQAEYRLFERKMYSERYDVEAVNAGVLHNKLLQFANGSMYQEDHNDIWIHDAKVDALGELLDRLDGKPLLLAYSYEFDVRTIVKKFPFAKVLGPSNAIETTRLWNEDKIPLLLAHRASAGHGLNMQKGMGHMCEYGLTTDVELYYQFLKRLLRPGRKFPVFNHIIMTEGTIDERVYPMYLDPRIETQNQILKAVRLMD